MSLDQILRDIYNDLTTMKHLDLINSEGTILRVERVWGIREALFFNFKDDKFRIEITRPEIHDFLSGNTTISDPQGKTYNIKKYRDCIVYKQKELDEFLK
jgi:hypothetical protein